MRPVRFAAAALVAVILAAPLTSRAANDYGSEPRQIGQFANWSAYRVITGGTKVCYMSTQPQKPDTKGKKDDDHRGDVYAMLTDRPSDGSHNVFSYITGYTYKPGSDVTVTIDKQHFNLFTKDDSAWAPDGATDEKIAAAISRGHTMTVTGTSSHGLHTIDNFDLGGGKLAEQALAKECGK